LSLVILAGVFAATAYFIPSRHNYNESKKVQIIEGEDEWILQYDIINDEGRDTKYTIQLAIDGAVHSDSSVVKKGRTYTYICHIDRAQLREGNVTLAVYKEGGAKAIDQATYSISFD